MKKEKQKSALFLHYYFPPVHSVGALRNFYLFNELKKKFKAYSVLTTSNRNILGKDGQLEIDSPIEAMPTFDYRTIIGMYSRKTHLGEHQKKGLKKHLIRLNLSFPFNLIWGEGGMVYIVYAYFRACRLIRKHKIDYIFSSFMPYSDHFIAFLLCNRFPRLFWVADFRDLHINPDRRNLVAYGFQRWCNRKILKKSSLITTVSKALAKELRSYNPKVVVVPNGFDIHTLTDRNRAISNNQFTVTYTGSIYRGKQNPAKFLMAIKQLLDEKQIREEHFKFVYAGKDSHQWQNWMNAFELETVFQDHGLVSRKKAIHLQQHSNVNLLLSWTSSKLKGILTAKVYEYLASGSPILVLLNGEGPDENWEELMHTTQGGEIFYADATVQTIAVYLLEAYQEWSRGQRLIKKKQNSDLVSAYSWQTIVNDFYNKQLTD